MDGLRISAFRRVVVVMIIVASLTRVDSSDGLVQLWTVLLCGMANVGIGQWIASTATMWWFASGDGEFKFIVVDVGMAVLCCVVL